jgi:hypothetical protein
VQPLLRGAGLGEDGEYPCAWQPQSLSGPGTGCEGVLMEGDESPGVNASTQGDSHEQSGDEVEDGGGGAGGSRRRNGVRLDLSCFDRSLVQADFSMSVSHGGASNPEGGREGGWEGGGGGEELERERERGREVRCSYIAPPPTDLHNGTSVSPKPKP